MLGFDKKVIAASIIWIGAVIWQETIAHGYVRTSGETLIFAAIFSIAAIWLGDTIAKFYQKRKRRIKKAKRRENGHTISNDDSRILMLLDVLSEQEKAEVKARLLNELEPDEFEEDLYHLLRSDSGAR